MFLTPSPQRLPISKRNSMTEQQKAEAYVRKAIPELKVPEGLPLPVKYDGMAYYWGTDLDGNPEVVADTVDDFEGGEFLRIRGWGRIQYLKVEGKTPEQLQDDVAYWIADAINAYAKPQLQHWLRVLGAKGDFAITDSGELLKWDNPDTHFKYWHNTGVTFNLTTGQPATEADYKTFNEITANT